MGGMLMYTTDGAVASELGWSIPDSPYALSNVTEGVAAERNLSAYATIPSGVTPNFSITSQSKGGTPGSYGITIDATTGVLTVPDTAAVDDYSVVVDLSDAIGALVHDGPATPEQMALWIPITGTVSDSATATVTIDGVASHPMYRVRPAYAEDPATTIYLNDIAPAVDGFAWTYIDLTPGTTYSVVVTVTNGSAVSTRTLSHTTRSLPAASGTANKTANSAGTIATQLASLVAGDVLEIADGTYDVSDLQLACNGTANSPIYIRGQSRAGTILRNTAAAGRVFQPRNCSYVVLERMTLQGSSSDYGGGGYDGSRAICSYGGGGFDYFQDYVTIRNVTMTGFDRAVFFANEGDGHLIYDCTMTGNNAWTPANLDVNLTWNDDGISLSGSGHCVFNNTLTAFGDTFAVSYHANPFTTSIGTHFYRNDIINGCDDTIEVDHGTRNITFYDNRCTNVMNATSLDPLYGGPFLCARNLFVNLYDNRVHKWNSANSGHFVYSNTLVSTVNRNRSSSAADDLYGWYQPNNGAQQFFGYRNNISVYGGAGSYVLFLDNAGYDYVDWTHNSWYPDRTFYAFEDSQASLAATQSGLANVIPVFSGVTRPFQNDQIIEAQPFVSAVGFGASSEVAVTVTTPTLSGTSVAKNSGVAIPGITDGFTGAAPDRGAIIAGRSVPEYGDRS